jgi:hypothetical protein
VIGNAVKVMRIATGEESDDLPKPIKLRHYPIGVDREAIYSALGSWRRIPLAM